MPRNKSPYLSFRFRVEVDNTIVANVSEVSGLQIEIETETYREGGVNNFVHNFPKGVKYQPLILKRGITDLNDMWSWYKDVRTGKITRKGVTVVLMDESTKDEKWRWTFQGAYPIKWTGPELKANSSTIAFESIELVHQGILDSQ
ncbi:MAG: phage tail protein [Methanosarcina sp.]|uniref:phage tail protein n=1 Tax=Methanosarcina sp. TaxID=2213 RepID=UPI00260E4626|nr:phage tail protein [Methanosarcina sp.]MDD3246398.1 phage tail protein [Methanosarcina sp.]